jgi:transcriptional regulator with XRE-family HTH domain
VTDEFNVSLGQRLRAARRQRGWSLGEIEAQTEGEFKASVVGAYERGERAISVQRFVRLAEIYGVPANEILPMPEHVAGLVIDLEALSGDDSGDLVDKYLAAIQLLRKDGGPNVVRQSDRAIINSLLQAVNPSSADI